MTAAAAISGPSGLDADLHPRLTPMQAMVESSRCVYCYDAPCMHACPTEIDIPGFIRRIADGNLRGAAVAILSANIMGGSCARVCPTEVLCESACVRLTGEQRPVAIGRLQRYATDALMEGGGRHPFGRAARSGRKVAVVGAGPAGLACAHRLATLGHDVAVFEAKEKPGGLNEYGIAAYKMADGFAAREAAFILDVGGIAVKYGQALGGRLKLTALREKYDAVFLAVGLGGAKALGVEGEDLKGVADALGFIESLRQAPSRRARPKVGRRVVVVGGGNTAVDAAVQARLLGAEEVVMAYRRGFAQMGATAYEQELAKSAGVTVRPWLAPVRIEGERGKVARVVFERTRLEGERLAGTGETLALPADMVLTAVGQTLRADALDGLRLRNGRVAIDKNYRTSLEGVFAGGDCVASGQDLTVQAVQDGKLAAQAIDAHLRKSAARAAAKRK